LRVAAHFGAAAQQGVRGLKAFLQSNERLAEKVNALSVIASKDAVVERHGRLTTANRYTQDAVFIVGQLTHPDALGLPLVKHWLAVLAAGNPRLAGSADLLGSAIERFEPFGRSLAGVIVSVRIHLRRLLLDVVDFLNGPANPFENAFLARHALSDDESSGGVQSVLGFV
jgi:hypothetical protein